MQQGRPHSQRFAQRNPGTEKRVTPSNSLRLSTGYAHPCGEECEQEEKEEGRRAQTEKHRDNSGSSVVLKLLLDLSCNVPKRGIKNSRIHAPKRGIKNSRIHAHDLEV